MCDGISTSITDKAWNVIKKNNRHWEKEGGGAGPTFIWYLYNASKGTKSAIFNIIGKMNIFRSEYEGHDTTRSTIGLKLVKMILKNPEGKTINF